MHIVAFGASTSKLSINKQFAAYALTYFPDATSTLLDLNDFPMPLFSVDLETKEGFPEQARRFLNELGQADLMIISMTEHNASYSAAFKNILDWCSRIDVNVFQNKPVFLLATSPGAYGAKNVLEAATKRFPRHGAELLETFSLPSFNDNFDKKKGIIEPELREEFLSKIQKVKTHFSE